MGNTCSAMERVGTGEFAVTLAFGNLFDSGIGFQMFWAFNTSFTARLRGVTTETTLKELLPLVAKVLLAKLKSRNAELEMLGDCKESRDDEHAQS